jgi:hypothetical protein
MFGFFLWPHFRRHHGHLFVIWNLRHRSLHAAPEGQHEGPLVTTFEAFTDEMH